MYMYLKDTCYFYIYAFHVYKTLTKHAASMVLFTLETNAGWDYNVYFSTINWTGKLAIQCF